LYERLRGHIDGELDGDLLEIKSVEDDQALDAIRLYGPRTYDLDQVQAYCRWGGYEQALVVYKSRASGRVWVVWVLAAEERGWALEAKARAVLAALDGGEAPGCECGEHEGAA